MGVALLLQCGQMSTENREIPRIVGYGKNNNGKITQRMRVRRSVR